MLLRSAAVVAFLILCGSEAAQAQIPTETEPARPGRRIGFIDASGKDIIAPKNPMESPYVSGRSFSDGFAAVQRADSSWNWVDANGRQLTKTRYATVTDFYDGIGWARDFNDTLRVVSVTREGKETAMPAGTEIQLLTRSRLAAHVSSGADGRRLGYMRADGAPATPATFQSLLPFRGGRGFLRAVKDGPMTMVDERGKVIVETEMYSGFNTVVSENRVTLRAKPNGPVGYLDTLGRWVIPPQFDDAREFRSGFAAVKLLGEKRWAVIDSTGKVVIQPRFSEAPIFYRDMARVKDAATGKFVFVNARLGADLPERSGIELRAPGWDGRRHVYFARVSDPGASSDSDSEDDEAPANKPAYQIRYLDANMKPAFDPGVFNGRRATIGHRFIEGFALVSYREPVVAQKATPENTKGLTRYVWYELHRTMPLTASADVQRTFIVYYGSVYGPPKATAAQLATVMPARPQQSLAPIIATNAFALENGEVLDIDEVLIKHERTQFGIKRKDGKEVIDENVRSVPLGDWVYKP